MDANIINAIKEKYVNINDFLASGDAHSGIINDATTSVSKKLGISRDLVIVSIDDVIYVHPEVYKEMTLYHLGLYMEEMITDDYVASKNN